MPLPKLFIPGPVDVSAATFAAMTQPLMGHRSDDFKELFSSLQNGLQQLAGTTRPMYLSTSSAWGIMEASLRNLTKKRVLNCCCGAFSDKWNDVALRCGKEADAYNVEWGEPIDPEKIRNRLKTNKYDSLTLVHSETSTGVLNPLEEIAQVVAEFPDVQFIVDVVSSFGAMKIGMDQLGIDVLLTGIQKTLAVPPGLCVFAVSERALSRAKTLSERGYYFDFLEFEKNALENMTPTTPAISLFYGLQQQLQSIQKEGLAARFERHDLLNKLVHRWVLGNGFEILAPEGFRAKTLTCAKNSQNIDVQRFVAKIRADHNIQIDGGYGKLKGTTFRISNMGNESEQSISELLFALSDSLSKI